MIIPNKFTPEELRKELLTDISELEVRYIKYAKANFNKTKRMLNQLPSTTKFPIETQTKSYTTKNNNIWYVYQYIENKKSYILGEGVSVIKFCIANSSNGYYVYIPVEKPVSDGMYTKNKKLFISVDTNVRIFTPHFFRRYKERMGLVSANLQLHDVVKYFLHNNHEGVSSKYTLQISKEFDNTASMVEVLGEGFALGSELSKDTQLMRTWVSWDMELPHQKSTFR